MTDTPARTTTGESALVRRLEERVASIESILLFVPVALAEILLVLSLFIPFITAEVAEDDETTNLISLPFQLFAEAGDNGEAGTLEIVFAVAFLLLLLVVVGSIVTIPSLGRGHVLSGMAGTVTAFVVLLVLGTAGAWAVIGMGMSSDSPWLVEPAMPLLTAGALLAAMVALLPAYRSIWAD